MNFQNDSSRHAFLQDLAKVIDKKLEERLAPVVARVVALEKTDRTHDAKILDATAEARRSKSEIEHKVGDTATALAARDQRIIGAINDFKTEVSGRLATVEQAIKPASMAAQGAQTAAVAAKDATTAIAVDAVQTNSSARSASRWSKLGPLIVVIVQSIVMGVLHALKN